MLYQNLIEQREQIQQDIICILDGLEKSYIDNVCQIVVERFQILIDKECRHTHVNSQNGTDACKVCGLDLRNEIHFRVGE